MERKLCLCLDSETIARIDALVERHKADPGAGMLAGARIGKSAVVRAALAHGLAALECEDRRG